MTTQERTVAKVTRYGKIEKTILAVLVVTGGLLLVAAAPNAFQMLKFFGLGSGARSGMQKATTRLVRKGLIVYEETSRGKRLRITPEGKHILARLVPLNQLPSRPKRWDKKWRLVIFDVPESKRAVRDKIRGLLTTVGFLRLQNSVWVYPHDCEELITLIKADLRVGKDVLYVIAASIENDVALQKYFELTR